MHICCLPANVHTRATVESLLLIPIDYLSLIVILSVFKNLFFFRAVSGLTKGLIHVYRFRIIPIFFFPPFVLFQVCNKVVSCSRPIKTKPFSQLRLINFAINLIENAPHTQMLSELALKCIKGISQKPHRRHCLRLKTNKNKKKLCTSNPLQSRQMKTLHKQQRNPHIIATPEPEGFAIRC